LVYDTHAAAANYSPNPVPADDGTDVYACPHGQIILSGYSRP
jgi:hypothetical protein